MSDLNQNKDVINENYYENIIIEIQRLISDGDKDKAFELLKEELSQPYVPKDVLAQLETIFEESFVLEVVSKQLTIEETKEALLNLKIETIVQSLFTLNLRLLSEEILYYLENSDDYLSMSLLVYNLIDQGINLDFTMSKFEITKTFNVIDLEVLDDEVMARHIELFEKEFEKTPVYVKYCTDILSYYFMVTFPFKLDNDFELYSEVVNYVKRVAGIESAKNDQKFLNIIEYGGSYDD